MKGGNARRIGAAALALVCLVVGVGQASAEEAAPTVSVNDASAVEGSPVTFKITLSAAATEDVKVAAATSGGSGYADRDETVTIPKGQTSVDYAVTTQGNDLDQPDRVFALTLSNPTGGGVTIADGAGEGKITDDDATPTLAITGPAPIEEGAVTASYTVTMTSKSALDVTVNYATANGSATAGANQDYDAKSGQLKWTAGETGAKSVDVQLREDTLDENDETFTVTLSGAANATVATGDRDDDDHRRRSELPWSSRSPTSRSEENAVGAPIAVVLDAPSAKTITISYQLGSAGTATLGSDFTLSNGTLTYAPGETTKSIPVSILEDTIAEPNETIVINLFGHVNVRPGDVDALVTIKDDGDAAPAPTVPAKSQSEGNSGHDELRVPGDARRAAAGSDVQLADRRRDGRRIGLHRRGRRPAVPGEARQRQRCQ